ncbi:MAG: DsrE family protein [Rhodobacteraceae bacterium]|nr:DsrE family protein [Paracoccaceae bacterium]
MFKKMIAAIAVVFMFAAPVFAQEQVVHQIAFHIDENDPKLMNMTLNNVKNVTAYFESIGEAVEIQVVAYGPGLHMLRADTSPVASRIAALSLEIEGLTFAACGNTMRKMAEGSGQPVELLDEAVVVTSGVVQLVLLQEAGWSYIRP